MGDYLSEEAALRRVFNDVFKHGREVAPRGQKTLEVQNHQLRLGPRQRWCTFQARGLKVEYVRREFRWYLRGDPADLSIKEVAKLWGDILNPDGTVNSNYGQYLIRGGGLAWVINELRRDPDSRRASAPILRSEHLREGVKDVPCTYGLNFRIRDGELHCSVHMRSQDLFWGFGNDLPCFSLFHELIAAALGVEVGDYCQTVDSLHVYERHWDALQQIVRGSPWAPVPCPLIAGPREAAALVSHTAVYDANSREERGTPRRVEYVPDTGDFTKWLYGDVAAGEPIP